MSLNVTQVARIASQDVSVALDSAKQNSDKEYFQKHNILAIGMSVILQEK